MQGCEEALTEYIQENLLIVATIAITFVVAEVHICVCILIMHTTSYALSVSQGLNLDNIGADK